MSDILVGWLCRQPNENTEDMKEYPNKDYPNDIYRVLFKGIAPHETWAVSSDVVFALLLLIKNTVSVYSKTIEAKLKGMYEEKLH